MSQVRLTGSGGGNTILNGNDTITADQTFECPNTGGTLLTGSQTETGSGGSSGSAKVVGYQQGTWTPTTNLGAAESIIHNSWSRIGNRVTIQAQLSSFNNSAASVIIVNGFPYPQSSDGLGSVMTSKFDNGPDASHISVGGGLTFFKNGTSKNSDWTQLRYVDRLDANSTVWFSISYLTNDTTWTPGNSATVS